MLRSDKQIRSKYVIGIYEFKCHSCVSAYVGETDSSKKTKFCERLRYTTTNVAFHSRSNQHESGPVDNTTDLIETAQKGVFSNCFENICTTASTGREISK